MRHRIPIRKRKKEGGIRNKEKAERGIKESEMDFWLPHTADESTREKDGGLSAAEMILKETITKVKHEKRKRRKTP